MKDGHLFSGKSTCFALRVACLCLTWESSSNAEGGAKRNLQLDKLGVLPYVFINVINDQLKELDKLFSKESSELVCIASCLNPRNLFQAFDKDKPIKFARFYPSEFPDTVITALDLQLQAFITDVRSDARFHDMSALSDLSVKMAETGKDTLYPLVYLLLKLGLILPGTPATSKMASSTMKFIDNTMMKEPCNQWTCDCLLLYLERDIFELITNVAILASL